MGSLGRGAHSAQDATVQMQPEIRYGLPAGPGPPDRRDCCLVQQETGCCLASRAGNAESEGSAALGKGERQTPSQKRPYYDLSDTQ